MTFIDWVYLLLIWFALGLVVAILFGKAVRMMGGDDEQREFEEAHAQRDMEKLLSKANSEVDAWRKKGRFNHAIQGPYSGIAGIKGSVSPTTTPPRKNRMKTLTLCIVAAALSGCGWFDRASSYITGNASRVCLGGVEYLQFTSGATVAYTPDGKIKTCVK